MKLTLNRKALQQAWKTAAAAVPSRTPKDILKSVKCEATGGVITLTATDSEVTIRVKVPGTITKEGACLLPADRFGSFLSAAIAEDVLISTLDSGVVVECGRSKVKLQTAKVDEYPVSSLELSPIVTLPAERLQKSVAFSMTAMDENSTRYALGGVYFGVKDGRLVVAATDSRRMTIELLVPCPEFRGVVVPARAAACLKSAGMSGDVSVSVSETAIAFESSDVVIDCRVLEGKWPEMGLTFFNGGRSFSKARIAAGIWCGLWGQVKATLDPESMGADCEFGESITLRHRGPAGESEAVSACEFSGERHVMRFAVDLVIPTSKAFDPTDMMEIEAANQSADDADDPSVFRAKCGDRMFLLMSMAKEEE